MLVPTARLVEVKAPRWGTAAGVIVLAPPRWASATRGSSSWPTTPTCRRRRRRRWPTAPRRRARAVRLNPLNPTYRGGVGLAYLDEVRASLQAGAQAQQNGEDTTPYAEAVRRSFANAETALKDAIAFVPDEYDNYVSLADLYNVGGGALTEDLYQSAIEVAEQGLEVDALRHGDPRAAGAAHCSPSARPPRP